MFKLMIINKIHIKTDILFTEEPNNQKVGYRILERMWGGRKPHALLGGCRLVCLLWKEIKSYLVILKNYWIDHKHKGKPRGIYKDFFSSPENIFFIAFREKRRRGEWREKEKERERDMDAREKQSIGSCLCPDQGSNPQLGICPDLESNLQTSGLWDNPPNQLSHTIQDHKNVFHSVIYGSKEPGNNYIKCRVYSSHKEWTKWLFSHMDKHNFCSSILCMYI